MRGKYLILILAVLVGTVVFSGCSKKTESTSTEKISSTTTENSAVHDEHAGHEHGEAAVTPAGTPAEIWTQITDEQGKLAAAIQNGQLADVHHLAFGIRDLVVALADKTTAGNPAAGSQLEGLVTQIKESASKLDELGDAGNLSGTQAEFEKFNTMLNGVKSAAGL